MHEQLEGKGWVGMELTDMAKQAGGDNPPPKLGEFMISYHFAADVFHFRVEIL